MGNVTQYAVSSAGQPTLTTNYSYDDANRLLTETRAGGLPANDFDNTYVYDKDGNRLSVTRGTNTTSDYTYVYSTDEFLSGDECTASSYDGDGNPRTYTGCSQTFTFAYDFEDRPSSLTLPGGQSVTYAIDGDSHRVGKTVNGQTTKYVYDGDNVVAEIGPTGVITYEVPDVGYVTGGVQNYYQENALGSTLSVTNNQGAVQSQNEYDAYGVTYSLVAGPQSDFRFAGGHNYVTDNETGLLELGHRYYIPLLGRFLTQDPIGQKDDLNLYEYCKDNPLVATDPSGTTLVYIGTSLAFLPTIATLNEISRNPVIAHEIAVLKASKNTYYIDANLGYSENYDAFNTNTNFDKYGIHLSGVRLISWGPKSGTEIYDNKGNDTFNFDWPDIALAHELTHAYDYDQNPAQFNSDNNTPSDNYLNQEELNAIDAERDLDRTLEEPERFNHNGSTHPVFGPFMSYGN